MLLLASLAFAFILNAADQQQNIGETVAVISVSVASIIGAIFAQRQQAAKKKAKAKPKPTTRATNISTEELDEIGARR